MTREINRHYQSASLSFSAKNPPTNPVPRMNIRFRDSESGVVDRESLVADNGRQELILLRLENLVGMWLKRKWISGDNWKTSIDIGGRLIREQAGNTTTLYSVPVEKNTAGTERRFFYRTPRRLYDPVQIIIEITPFCLERKNEQVTCWWEITKPMEKLVSNKIRVTCYWIGVVLLTL